MKKDYSKILEKLGEIQTSGYVVSYGDQNISIEQLETYFQTELPKDYVSLIKETGVIRFNKQIKTKAKENIPIFNDDNIVPIDNFFDFSDSKLSVVNTLDRFKGNIPSSVLPICEGSAGDLVVINFSKIDNGKIFYWYHEHEEGNDGLYLLADNFEEFINSLFIDEESDDNISTDDVKVTKISDKFIERLKKSGKLK